MGTAYDIDVAAWASEQAALLRTGHLAALDTVNLADEIGAIARDERRELGRRVAALVAQLLCWKFQTGNRCEAWRRLIRMQREAVYCVLEESPSLNKLREDRRWLRLVWLDAVGTVAYQLGVALPEELAWPVDTILDGDFWPD